MIGVDEHYDGGHYDEYALGSEYVRVICWSYPWFLIKFPIIGIWQGSEYVSSSEYASVTQGSVENSPSYMLDRVWRIPRVINKLGLEYTKVLNFTSLHKITRL